MGPVVTKQHGNRIEPVQTSGRYTWLSAILAFFLWGGWAFYINRGHGPWTKLFSGIIQGTGSFITTFIMVGAITWLFHCFHKSWQRLILPPMLTVGCIGSCLACVHYLIGTPRVFLTILPALSVAFCFCLVTAIKLYNHFSLQGEIPPARTQNQANQGH